MQGSLRVSARAKQFAVLGAGLLCAVTASVAIYRHRHAAPAPMADGGVVVDAGPTQVLGRVDGVVGPDPRVGAATIELHQAGHVVKQPLDGGGRFGLAVGDGPFVLYGYSADRQWQVVQCEPTPPPAVKLSWSRAASASGDLSDDGHHPLPAPAQVTWRPLFADAGCGGVAIAAPTDAHARFAVLHPAVDGMVTAEADGFWPAQARVGGAPLHLVLEAAAALEGTVKDERGQPVVGARLALALANGGSAVGGALGSGGVGVDARLRAEGELGVLVGPVPFPPFVATVPVITSGAEQPLVTDAQGHFFVARVVAGEVTVQAAHPQFASTSVAVVLRAGERGSVMLTLPDGATVEGEVHDADGTPLAAADVALLDGGATRSDSRGHFTLTHALLGQSLTVRHAGFRPGRALTALTVEVVLERADHALAGVVVDPAGQGVAGAELTVGLQRSGARGQRSRWAIQHRRPGRAAPRRTRHAKRLRAARDDRRRRRQ